MRRTIWKLGVLVVFIFGLDFGGASILVDQELKVTQDEVRLNYMEHNQDVEFKERIESGSKVSKDEDLIKDKGGVESKIDDKIFKKKVLDEEIDENQKENGGCEIVRMRNEMVDKHLINRRWWIFKNDCQKGKSRKNSKESQWRRLIRKKMKVMKMSLIKLLLEFAAWLGLPFAKFAKFTFRTLRKSP
ncbi:secreted protein [Melampsora americana]|nr:secreted protein [Melampsora americana]